MATCVELDDGRSVDHLSENVTYDVNSIMWQCGCNVDHFQVLLR